MKRQPRNRGIAVFHASTPGQRWLAVKAARAITRVLIRSIPTVTVAEALADVPPGTYRIH